MWVDMTKLPVEQNSNNSVRQVLLDRIKAEPNNATAYKELGDYYAQRDALVTGISQYRTALAFEKSETTLRSLAAAYRKAGYVDFAQRTLAELSTSLESSKRATAVSKDQSTLQALDATRYQRLWMIARRTKELYNDHPPRVLDVGGSDGALCLFLPESEYVLAEPTTNGLTATELRLPDHSFDIVLACEVMEHMPLEMRERFLSQLCLKSKGYVLLLQYFAVTGIEFQTDRLVYEITKVDWAHEHLANQLPTLGFVQEFAKRNQLSITVTPNSASAALYWIVFAYYFAGVAQREAELERVTRFFNAHYAEQMTNPLQPNDYLIELNLNDKNTPDRK